MAGEKEIPKEPAKPTEPRPAAAPEKSATAASGNAPMTPNTITASAAGGATRRMSEPGSAPATGANSGDEEAAEGLRQQVQQSVNEGIETVQRVANEYYQKLSELSSQYYADGQQYVRQHPGGSIGGAFVLGVLLGVLIRRV